MSIHCLQVKPADFLWLMGQVSWEQDETDCVTPKVKTGVQKVMQFGDGCRSDAMSTFSSYVIDVENHITAMGGVICSTVISYLDHVCFKDYKRE